MFVSRPRPLQRVAHTADERPDRFALLGTETGLTPEARDLGVVFGAEHHPWFDHLAPFAEQERQREFSAAVVAPAMSERIKSVARLAASSARDATDSKCSAKTRDI